MGAWFVTTQRQYHEAADYPLSATSESKTDKVKLHFQVKEGETKSPSSSARQSDGFVNRWPRVQIPSGAPSILFIINLIFLIE